MAYHVARGHITIMKRVVIWGAAIVALAAAIVALQSFLDWESGNLTRALTPSVVAGASDNASSSVPVPVVPVPQADSKSEMPPASPATERTERAKARVKFVEGQMKEVHKTILQEMRNPWAYLYYEPVMKDGKMVGLQFTAPEEREFLRQHGLDLGDVITGINGHDLDGGIGLAQAVTALTQDEHLSLRVRRGDRTFTVQASTGQNVPEQ
jgi:hypothetical protein